MQALATTETGGSKMTAWEIVSITLKTLTASIKEGVTPKELDELAESIIKLYGGRPFNKGYQPKFAKTPFPATVCISVDSEIAHGIPNDIPLKKGQILSIDVGVEKDGLCGDAALTVGVGKITREDQRLINAAKEVLFAGISKVKAGANIKIISLAIEQKAEELGYVTNMIFGGHGIGEKMHQFPTIPNFASPRFGSYFLREGEMICLEPQITYTDRIGFVDQDGWTRKTGDGEKSAFFEHQLLVTKAGCKILTNHF